MVVALGAALSRWLRSPGAVGLLGTAALRERFVRNGCWFLWRCEITARKHEMSCQSRMIGFDNWWVGQADMAVSINGGSPKPNLGDQFSRDILNVDQFWEYHRSCAHPYDL